jgi:hypothetical protein
MKKLIFMSSILLVVCGCGTKKPVLYPNAHLQSVGPSQSQFDIDECCSMADAYVKSGAGSQVAKDAAVGGAVGGAAGAAYGSVWGGSTSKRAGAGAAAGAAAAATRGLFRAKEPSPVYKGFVNRCLQEKGYSVVGWQ